MDEQMKFCSLDTHGHQRQERANFDINKNIETSTSPPPFPTIFKKKLLVSISF